ncbi:Uncharacterised protein [uncultured archaeon]|nr:Uncharacterised protein [uncultured archaeon]
MARKTVSSVDGGGRVRVPQAMMDALNVQSGEGVLFSLDPKNKSITIVPARAKKLLHLEASISDSPGALAKAAGALAGLGADLVFTQSHSLVRGEAATWIVDCNPGKATVQQIRAALAKAGANLVKAHWE